MKNPDFNKIVTASINAAHLFSISGMLNAEFPGHNADVFCGQCIAQVEANGIDLPDPMDEEDYDMLLSHTVDFSIPICAILDICEMMLELKNRTEDKAKKSSVKFLMGEWNSFPLGAAEYLLGDEKPTRRYDELGPESLN